MAAIGKAKALGARLTRERLHHGGVMAERGCEHKGVPNRVLEAQAPPSVEHDTSRIKRSTCADQGKRHWREGRGDQFKCENAAPTHREIKPNRCAVEAAGPKEFDRDAGQRDGPEDRENNDRGRAVHR